MYFEQFQDYLSSVEKKTNFPTNIVRESACIEIQSSGRRGDGGASSIPLKCIVILLKWLEKNADEIKPYAVHDGNDTYKESNWRNISRGKIPEESPYAGFVIPTKSKWTIEKFDDPILRQAFGSQTKPIYRALIKIIAWANGIQYTDDLPMPVSKDEIKIAISRISSIANEVNDGLQKIAISHGTGKNVIIYGAPGTGKSYKLKHLENMTRCVFHSDYLNSDFVGGYKPTQDGETIKYKFVPGPFIKVIAQSILNKEKHFNLIIEEINRGNAGAIFGELIQLLDRDLSGKSEYTIGVSEELNAYMKEHVGSSWHEELYLPSNMSIYATMNSADQGVMPLDSAFKRRWEFEFIPITYQTRDVSSNMATLKIDDAPYSWSRIAQAINCVLSSADIEEDRLIGQYFISNSELANHDRFRRALGSKLFIYLWDDVLRHGNRHLVFGDQYKSFSALQDAFNKEANVFSDSVIEVLAGVEAQTIDLNSSEIDGNDES